VRRALLVAVGGGMGAVLRYGMLLVFPSAPYPWAVFLTNVAGSVAIGGVMALVLEGAGAGEDTRLFGVVGVLGGFTTFSTFTAEVLTLGEAGRLLTALVYVVASFVAGIAGVRLGAAAIRARVRRQDAGNREEPDAD
jgi:CrcB protein